MKREEDFQIRREKIKNLSDEELYNYFWKLSEKIVEPLVDIAYYHTSPAIERSVLLRMGFSSLEAEAIVRHGAKWKLLGYGMGNAVLTLSNKNSIPYREAGLILAAGKEWEEVKILLCEEKV